MTEESNAFAKDNFSRHVGIELIETRPGYARAMLEIGPQHLNGIGLVHGGAIYTLAVWTLAVAGNAANPDRLAVGINASISYLKSVREGTIYAEANQLSEARKTTSFGVRVTDETGEVIATLHGLAYAKHTPKG